MMDGATPLSLEEKMLKKLPALALAGVLLNMVAVGRAHAAGKTQADKDARNAEKVKRAVARLGTGEKAHIKVKLKDDTKVKGYVSRIGDDDFQVTDAKSGAQAQVAYAQVRQIEGKNFTTGEVIAISVGIAAGVVLVLGILVFTSLN